MSNLKLVFLLVCLHLSFIMNAYGTVHKCVESDGTIIFQNYPCATQENQKNDIYHQPPKTNLAETQKPKTGTAWINPLENTRSDDLKDVKISTFKAYYYTENDGENPGKGNDGTIKGLKTKLQFTENVKRPSLNFIYSDFHGINSYNFYGVWAGTIHVSGEGHSAKAHFDVSKGDVSLYVNDDLVEKWRDDSKIVQFNLKKGSNKIRVELHNHWHTTSFNVSFTDYQKLDKSAASEIFEGIDFNTTKAVYIGTNGASTNNLGENYNEILVTLSKSTAPVFIFLNSYRAVNWVINNPHNVKIVGVALQGRSPGSTVAMKSSAPIYELQASRNAYKNSHSIREFIGKNADYAITKSVLSNIIIPDFFQEKANDYPKENGSISSSDSSRPGQTDKYPVNSFVESLVVQRQNGTVKQERIVKEPAFDGIFIKGSWKGYLEVTEPTDKSFKISHQGVRGELIIDGRSVWQGNNTGEKTYQHTFRPGSHEVMFIAYSEVESGPVKFNVSITDNAKNLKYDELASQLKGLGDFDSIYCGVEEGKSPHNTVEIILKDSGKPVVLFLSSYKRAIWDFKNCNTNKLAAVVTSAKNASESIKNLPPHIPIYHFFTLANTSRFIPVHGKRNSINNTFKSAALQILALTGKLPAGFSGAKQTDTIAAPDIILDEGKYRDIGFADVSPDYNIFIEYPQKIDAVFNPVTTKYIAPNNSSKRTRDKEIKPEIQRKSWAEPLGATEDIPTGTFKAYYFDIYNPDQPKFSGIVEDVAVNSSGKIQTNSAGSLVYQHGIIPENFGAFWIGNIALDEDKEMEINIDQSNATTRVLIDNKVIKERKILLKKGLHKIEIEHVNNWHTYGFSFSLSEPQTLLAYEELKEQLENILPKKVHTAYVGVYDSKSDDTSITLDIKNVGRPIFLILASYHAVNWVIEGPGAKDVKALLLSSMRSKSKIKGNEARGISRYYFPMSSYTYQLESNCECKVRYYCSSRDLFDTIDYIETISGRKIDSFTGNYNAESFLVPETIIDKKQFKMLKKVAKDNLQAQSKCEGPEFTPQYLSRKLRKQIDKNDSAQVALKYMESIRDNNFEDFIQFMKPGKRNTKTDGIKQMFLFQHNNFAGYDPSIAYHLIDKKMHDNIIASKTQLTIPLVLKRKNIKDYYTNVHMSKVGDRWYVSYRE